MRAEAEADADAETGAEADADAELLAFDREIARGAFASFARSMLDAVLPEKLIQQRS